MRFWLRGSCWPTTALGSLWVGWLLLFSRLRVPLGYLSLAVASLNCLELPRREFGEEVSNVPWSRNHLFHDQIDQPEEGRKQVIIGVQVDRSRVNRLVAHDPQNVHRLLNMRIKSSGDECSDLCIDAAAAWLEVVDEQLQTQAKEPSRALSRYRCCCSCLLVDVSDGGGHLLVWLVALSIQGVDHEVFGPDTWFRARSTVRDHVAVHNREPLTHGMSIQKVAPLLLGIHAAGGAVECLSPRSWIAVALHEPDSYTRPGWAVVSRTIGAQRFHGWEGTDRGSVGAVTRTRVTWKVAGCDAGTEVSRAWSENGSGLGGEGLGLTVSAPWSTRPSPAPEVWCPPRAACRGRVLHH